MKVIKSLLLLLVVAFSVLAACNKMDYRKAKSGLLYKIYPGNGKDSLIKDGQYVKFEMVAKLGDSTLYSSYGKMPGYAKVSQERGSAYSVLEILPQMRKGDSAVTVQMVDSLLRQGVQLPPVAKKGDRIVTSFRIIEVFTTDSAAMADYNRSMELDRPRQMKEQEEQMAKMEKERLDQDEKDYQDYLKSGEAAKAIADMEAYLKSKNIPAQKTGRGTFVHVQQQGTGPQAENGKYVTVNYTGKFLSTDSVFQSNTHSFQLGKLVVIRGWDEGLLLFKQGGKGTLYIPGFVAYAKNPPQGSPFKPYEPLKFDVEVVSVSDTAALPQRR